MRFLADLCVSAFWFSSCRVKTNFHEENQTTDSQMVALRHRYEGIQGRSEGEDREGRRSGNGWQLGWAISSYMRDIYCTLGVSAAHLNR